MKYKFSNGEKTYIAPDGKEKTVSICDVCGKEHQNNFGFEISLAKHSLISWSRTKLCGRCAREIVPIIFEAQKKAFFKVQEGRKKYE